jgi:hypothetical protein
LSQVQNKEISPAPLLGKHMSYPFAGGNYTFGLGLVPMRDETWLDIDEHYVAEMSEKARRLRDEFDAVFCTLPGSEPGQTETLNLLLHHLSTHYPNFFCLSGRGAETFNWDSCFHPDVSVENLLNGEVWPAAEFAQAPLGLAARLIQEDLCVMSPDGKGSYILTAGSVRFPLRWELRDKMGQPMAEIHHPVPDYDEKLAAPADRYMVGLKASKPSWRCNWTIVDNPNLYLRQQRHELDKDSEISPANAGARLWIRSERQTLRRLPISGDVLFTIRTYIRPLSVLESLPSVARGLADALEKLPPQMRSYKNLLPIRLALLAYLGSIT